MKYFKHLGIFGQVDFVYESDKQEYAYDQEISKDEYNRISNEISSEINDMQPQ